MIKEAYYFSHDSNARYDPKISAMRSVYGTIGYGYYWIIVEMLREQEGYKLDIKSKYVWNAYALQMQCEVNACKEFILDCVNEFGLFDSDGEFFWSESLNKRMEKREKVRESKRKSAQARWNKAVDTGFDENEDANVMHMHNERNADVMLVKESKGKERKGKEKKEDNINNGLELNLVEEEKIAYTETIYLTEKQYQKIVKDYEGELDFIESEFKNATLWMQEPTHFKKWKNKDINLFIRRWMNKTFKDYLYKKEIRNKTKSNNSQSKIEMANAGRSHNIQNTLFLDGGI